MEQIGISAQQREVKGKGPVRRLRVSGKVPGVLYGPGVEGAIALSLNMKDLDKVLHTAAGGNVLVNLTIEGEAKPRTVMFKEIMHNPLDGSIEHIDLLQIQTDHKVTVEVPVHIVGKALGLVHGGIIQHVTRKIKIECLPTQIPDSIDVDVTPLNIGQAFHFRDLRLAEGLKVFGDPDATVVSVVAPTAEVVAKTSEEVAAELSKSFEEKKEEAPEEEAEGKKK